MEGSDRGWRGAIAGEGERLRVEVIDRVWSGAITGGWDLSEADRWCSGGSQVEPWRGAIEANLKVKGSVRRWRGSIAGGGN